jgi:UDP-glucose 4-epimerase
MRCLIIGGNGYIAKNLIHLLLRSEGIVVVSTDIQPDSDYRPTNSNFTYIQGDLTDTDFLDSLDWNVDVIYYMAGLTGTQLSLKQSVKFVTVNEIGLLNVLDRVIALSNRPRIIYPSTRLVYKGSDQRLTENSEKEFKTIYSINKYSCERYLDIYNRTYGLDYVIFRICVPYGNITESSFSYGTVGMMIRQAKQGKITLYGDGSLRRTFTFIGDIGNILTLAATQSNISGEIYNIGGDAFSLKEIAQHISEKLPALIEFVKWPESDIALESGDTVFDDSKLRRSFYSDYRGSFSRWLNDYIIT